MVEYVGDSSPDQVDTNDGRPRYAALQQDGRTQGTLPRSIRDARACFFWLGDPQACSSIPAAPRRHPVVTQRRRDQFCAKAAREVLVASARDNPESRFVLRCGFFLGMRINQIVNCRCGWLEDTPCTIRSEPGQNTFKTKPSRMVSYHGAFRTQVQSLVRGRPNEWVRCPKKQPGKSPLRWDPRVTVSA